MTWAPARLAPRVAVLVMAVAMVLGAPIGQAGAQDEGIVQPLPAQLSGFVGTLSADTEATLDASLRLDTGPTRREDLRLTTTVFERVTDTAQLRAAFAGDAQAVFSSVSTDLPDLAAGTSRLQDINVPIDDLSLDDPTIEGVFPVEFRIFQAGESVAAVSTAVIMLPAGRPSPLPAALVVTVAADAVPMLDAVASPSLQNLLRPDGPLVGQSRDLAATADDGSASGLTLALSGRLLLDLETMAGGFTLPDGSQEGPEGLTARRAAGVVDRIRTLLRRSDTESLALPYGPADIVALVRGGQPDEAVRLLDTGRQVTGEVTESRPTAGILVPPDGVDATTVAALGAAQAQGFLLEERYLSFAEDTPVQPVRRLRTADGGEVRILMPDEGLSSLLRDPRGEGTTAIIQQLRAETALQWLSDDASPSTGVLMSVTTPSDVSDGMLQAVTDMMAEAPWLRPMTLSSLSRQVRPSSRLVRLAYPPSSRAAELDEAYIARLGEAREALVPIRALLPAGDGTATAFGRSLLVAAALPYRDVDHRAAGMARIDQALQSLGDLSEAISVVEGPPVTLTSTTGEIPVTILNNAVVPLNVVVRVGSTGFAFDDAAADLTLPPQSVQTITFRARALSPGGLAGVAVSVEDPSGGLMLQEATIAVRSTAFPIVAVIAVIGGFSFLLVWVFRESRRRRRPRGRHAARRGRRSAA